MEVDLPALLNGLSGQEVCVLGDAILDRYERGRSHQLCREAPVPAVEITSTDLCPGGAGNAAVNIAALGGAPTVLSVVGADVDGRSLSALLDDRGVRPRLVHAAARTTPFRRRIVVGDRMVLRLDGGSGTPIDHTDARALVTELVESAGSAGTLVVSDYGGGVVTPEIRAELADLRERFRVVVVDTKNPGGFRSLRPDAVTPDYAEAAGLLGLPFTDDDDERVVQLTDRGDDLLAATGARSVLVTLGQAGVMLFEPGRPPFRSRPAVRADRTVVGTGDVFAAALAMALAAGADLVPATELATAAAAGSALATARLVGTAVVDPTALQREWRGTTKLLHETQLAEWAAACRSARRRIVFTNGCFDLMHEGHVALLSQAKALGDVLVVAVNDDDSVRSLKGADRPVIDLTGRLRLLSALSCVDHVVSFGGASPAALIGAVQPDVFVKGGDYTVDTLPEGALLRSLRVEVRLLGHLPGRSTTQIIERVRARTNDGG